MEGAASTPDREFDRNIRELAQVFGFLDETLQSSTIDARSRLVLQLAVEELFTNMVKYNPDSTRRITVRIAADPDQVEIQLVDPDTDDFDPRRHPPADTTAAIEERSRGGLGIHLVRTLTDTIDYRYEGREMTVSVSKRLE